MPFLSGAVGCCGVVHGDFVITGGKQHLEAIAQHMGAKFKSKMARRGRDDERER